jgi:hypothetical protein
MSAFYLKDSFGKIQHRMYMIRNPWSTSSYIGKWNPKDSKWTKDFIS